MKKRLSYIFLSFLILPCLIMLGACDKNPDDVPKTELTTSMVSLEYTSTTYNETAKTPAVVVKVNGETIDAANYNVVYSNNINVGTGRVKVTAKEDSKLIKGEVEKTFTITRVNTVVSNYEQLNAALNNTNYVNISLNGNVVIPEGGSLTVRKGVSLTFGVFTLTNNGTFTNNGTVILSTRPTGNGTITNNGTITANVNTRESLINAMSYASKIVLSDSIVGSGEEMLAAVDIDASIQAYNFTLDLNGKNLGTKLVVRGNDTNKINVTITNSSSDSSTVGLNNVACNYGIIVLGDGDNSINVTLNKVNFVGYQGGIATNGRFKNAVITATNCIFEGKNLDTSDLNALSVGAYLPAQYGYIFRECTFSGYTGYYTKSGNHVLSNCTVNGEGTNYLNKSFFGSGCHPTGSAVVCDSATNYLTPLFMNITGGKLNSVSGYGLEEFSTSATAETVSYAEIIIAGGAKFKGELGEYVSQNSVITNNNPVEE